MKVQTFSEVCQAHIEVEREYGIVIDEKTTREVFEYCVRKLKRIGKNEDYLPILHRCELPMQLAMREVNKLSRFMYEERKKGGEGYVFGMSYAPLSPKMS